MGQQIIKSAQSDNNFVITAVTENRRINKKISKINVGFNNEKTF